MPFPWKKVKSTKVSRFVNNHLHNSQKRRDGSSLVVETGFPTSLVDLFIKNREKWNKSLKKKRASGPGIAPIDVNNQVISECPTPYPSPLPFPSRVVNETIVVRNSCLCCPSPTCYEGINVIGDVERSSVVGVDRDWEVNGKGVFLAVLKMFLVMVLALGSTRLMVGITLSAFLLFFLDSAGKWVSGFLNSCLVAKRGLKLVGSLFRFKRDKKDQMKNRCFVMSEIKKVDSCSCVMNCETRCSVQEIELVEPEVDLRRRIQKIQRENEIMDNFDFEVRFKYQENKVNDVGVEKKEFLCVGGELKRKKSRSDKIKSKVKKLMPKKIRNSKKEKHDFEGLEIFSEDNVAFSEELERGSMSSKFSSVSSGRYKEENARNVICDIGGSSEVTEELAIKREEVESKKTKTVVIWRYLVLCLIVLIGLIGGRAFALVLTLSWFFLLKFGENLHGYIKVPVISPFDDKST